MSKDIRNGAKRVVLGLACLALAAAVRADIPTDNPCKTITSRNIFDLHDEKVINPVPPAKPAANVKLKGITTIFGMKQALLLVNDPAVDGKAPMAHSVVLGEGQRFGGVEVLKIDPEARSVKVKQDNSDFIVCFSAKETGK